MEKKRPFNSRIQVDTFCLLWNAICTCVRNRQVNYVEHLFSGMVYRSNSCWVIAKSAHPNSKCSMLHSNFCNMVKLFIEPKKMAAYTYINWIMKGESSVFFFLLSIKSYYIWYKRIVNVSFLHSPPYYIAIPMWDSTDSVLEKLHSSYIVIEAQASTIYSL